MDRIEALERTAGMFGFPTVVFDATRIESAKVDARRRTIPDCYGVYSLCEFTIAPQ